MISRSIRVLAVALLITAIASGECLAEEPMQARPLTSANYTPLLEKQYPTVKAVVVSRGDCAIFEYYGKDITSDTLLPVHSVTKSVLSILVGVAIDKGYLRLDETMQEVVPDAFDDTVDPRAREITVRDLLTKTEGFAEHGIYAPTVNYPDAGYWRWMLDRPVKYDPGTHFRYDGIGTDLLSVILSHAIRQDAEVFARDNLLNLLHIDNYNWISSVGGNLLGETGLGLTARDMAKIGLLYFQHGRWGDRQIVSDSYVEASVTRQNDGGPPTNAGYGYLWWIGRTKTNLPVFFAAGYGSQAIYVVPKLNVVVAVAGDKINGGSRRFINDVILPAEALLPPSVACVRRLAEGEAQPAP